MKHRFRIGLAVALVLIAVSLGALAWRVGRLNADWPPAVAHIAEPGEPLALAGWTVTVTDAELVDGFELPTVLPGFTDLMQDNGQPLAPADRKAVIVHLEAVNDSVEARPFSSEFALQSGAWSDIHDKTATLALRPGQAAPPEIAPGGSGQHDLVFLLYAFQFRGGVWEHLDQRAFELTRLDYPDKYVLRLPPLDD